MVKNSAFPWAIAIDSSNTVYVSENGLTLCECVHIPGSLHHHVWRVGSEEGQFNVHLWTSY